MGNKNLPEVFWPHYDSDFSRLTLNVSFNPCLQSAAIGIQNKRLSKLTSSHSLLDTRIWTKVGADEVLRKDRGVERGDVPYCNANADSVALLRFLGNMKRSKSENIIISYNASESEIRSLSSLVATGTPSHRRTPRLPFADL